MRQLLYYILVLGLLLVSWTCNTKIIGENGFVSETDGLIPDKKRSVIDQFIYDSFTVPFNVEIKYRFDGFDNGPNSIGTALVPPIEGQIVPLLRAIRRVWIEPYLQVKDSIFLRTYIPKQIVLVGSARYEPNGSKTLGVAEGGKRILLFDVNNYSVKRNPGGFKEMIHTIQHEFAHILHQTILFDPAYRSISSPSDYTIAWINIDTPENYRKGFVTPYSMANPEEDFVEVLSTVLVESKKDLDSIVKSHQSGRILIERKYVMVKEYLSNIWQINMDKLEKQVQMALKEVKEDNTSKYDPPNY